jgi:membrane protease YdiL (CAAX protease family)
MTTVPVTRSSHVLPPAGLLARRPLAAFFALAYAGSWIVWLPLVLAGNNLLLAPSAIPPGLAFLLTVLAPFAGPTLAAFVITAVVEGRAGLRVLLGRYAQWRFGLWWYAAALGLAPIALLAAVAVRYGLPARVPGGMELLELGLSYLVTLLVNLCIGGVLGEEPGWRGFALPRLQTRYGPLLGSLILSLFWSFWHLPLILTPGGATWTGNIGLYVALNVALTILHTWVFNGTRGSLVGVLLLHASVNTSARMILPAVPGLSRDTGNLLLVALYAIVALLILGLSRGRLAIARQTEAAERAPLVEH